MRTRSWLAIALVGGLAVAGSAASGALAKSPQTAEVVELSLLDNSIKGGKNEAAAT